MACRRHYHDGQGPARPAPWPPEGARQAPLSGGAYPIPVLLGWGLVPLGWLSSWRRAMTISRRAVMACICSWPRRFAASLFSIPSVVKAVREWW